MFNPLAKRPGRGEGRARRRRRRRRSRRRRKEIGGRRQTELEELKTEGKSKEKCAQGSHGGEKNRNVLFLMQWEGGGGAEEGSGVALKQEVWGFPRRGRSLSSCGAAWVFVSSPSASLLWPHSKSHIALPLKKTTGQNFDRARCCSAVPLSVRAVLQCWRLVSVSRPGGNKSHFGFHNLFITVIIYL